MSHKTVTLPHHALRQGHWALCAGPAVAATLITGASAASAAVITPVSNNGVAFGPHGPSHPNCNRWQLERWNLNGSNTITAIYNNALSTTP
jgi:hypothetical protein